MMVLQNAEGKFIKFNNENSDGCNIYIRNIPIGVYFRN
jgi:hypothetical protein